MAAHVNFTKRLKLTWTHTLRAFLKSLLREENYCAFRYPSPDGLPSP